MNVQPCYLLLSTIALLTAVACKGSMGCDVCRTTAIANVFVKDSANQPVAGVYIAVGAYAQTCGVGLIGFDGPARTGSSGTRRMLMSSLYSPHTAECLRVIVSPGTNPNQPNDTADFVTTIQFREEDNSPRDSVRLDVVIGSTPMQ